MENNFNLRKFLTENKLTSNSKLLKEDFAPSPNSDLMDANAEDFDVATAFKKARVDMSKPVMVLHTYGSAAFGGSDSKEMSAEDAIKKLEAERQDRSKQYTDDGKEVPSDWHSYEFENSSVLEEDMPEGHEYKLAYFQTGDADFVITQEKSGVSEKKGKEVSEADRDEESMVHELIGDLFAPGNGRSHLDLSVKEIARALKRYGDDLPPQGVKDAMDLYDKLAADGTLDKEVEDGDGFISSYHIPKLKKAFELIGLYNVDELAGGRQDLIKK